MQVRRLDLACPPKPPGVWFSGDRHPEHDCGGIEWEEMKKLHLAPYCIALALGNCFLPSLVGQAADWMRSFFEQGVAGGRDLPAATQLVLAMPLWFYIFTALSVLASVGLCIRRVSISLLVHLLLVACILECVALFFFALGICLPFFVHGPG
jgi:hypothetical protein